MDRVRFGGEVENLGDLEKYFGKVNPGQALPAVTLAIWEGGAPQSQRTNHLTFLACGLSKE